MKFYSVQITWSQIKFSPSIGHYFKLLIGLLYSLLFINSFLSAQLAFLNFLAHITIAQLMLLTFIIDTNNPLK